MEIIAGQIPMPKKHDIAKNCSDKILQLVYVTEKKSQLTDI
jgi:hypothetical protein